MRVCAFAAVVAVLVAGCGGSDETQLDVFAASSMRDVAPEVDDAPRYTFAGSDELAAQIRDGAPADVFLSASGAPMEELRSAGLVDAPVVFASNRLVVVVPEGNPAGLEKLGDLARPGIKLILGGEGVPIGDYAREALAAAGLEAALENVVSLEQDVKGVLGKVALGEADAGIVYTTDVRAAAEDVRELAIPDDVQPDVRYYAAVVAAGDTDRAAEFVERLAGDEGGRALRAAGFLPVPSRAE
ncbi:MAG TPA: molybdate ABC transporter substrate-binding protein [Gaiellaceae bacterium]|nr:molybdate ABC transporter substrate-binding protein [Gaiellaceae bacterium]